MYMLRDLLILSPYVMHALYYYSTDLYSDLTSYSCSSSSLFMFQQLLYSIIYITSGILLASYCKHVVYVIHYVLYCTSVKGPQYIRRGMYVCMYSQCSPIYHTLSVSLSVVTSTVTLSSRSYSSCLLFMLIQYSCQYYTLQP